MRKFLVCAVAMLAAAAACAQTTTTITSSHIAQDVTGTLLPAGKFCLTPIAITGAPSAFQANGVQYPSQQACVSVTNGVISGFTVPDTLAINPPGVGYRVAITNATGATVLTWAQPIFPTGASWSFDTWAPTQSVAVPSPATVNYSVSAPQGRCGLLPAVDYTATTVYTCINQVWVPVVSSSGSLLNSATIAGALGFAPVSPAVLTAAINAIPPIDYTHVVAALGFVPTAVSDVEDDIDTALESYVPLTGGTLSGALKQTVAPVNPTDLVNKQYVDGLFTGGAPTTPTFSPAAGTYSSTQSVTLTQAAGAAISYCSNATGNCTPNIAYSSPINVATSETICASAISSGGIVSAISCDAYTINTGSPGTPTGTGIGTVLFQSYLTDGSLAYKTCSQYPGAVCSGGVGTGVPSSAPTHTFGLNAPSAGTGLSNKVGNFHLESGTAGTFIEALWTTTGGGVGANATPTNYYVGGYVKAVFVAGAWRLEFDPYAFDSGWDWMWGTQCNGDKSLIQTANQSSSWTYQTVPCGKLLDGNYHHLEMTFHRTLAADRSCGGGTAPCAVWDTVSIDGVSYALNVTMPATTSTWAGSGWQFQIDGNATTASSGSPAKYDLWCDSCQFIAGTAATAGSPGGGGTSTAGTGDLASNNFDGSTSIPAGLTATGSPVIDVTKSHSPSNSLHAPSGLNYVTQSINPVSQIYTRQYIYVNTENLSLTNGFLRFYHGASEMFVFYFSASGTISYFDSASGTSVTAATSAYPVGAWHLVETYTKIDPTAGHVTVKVDGTQVYDSGSGSLNTGSTTVNSVWFGNIGNTAPTGWDTYQDNVDFDDTAWIGPI